MKAPVNPTTSENTAAPTSSVRPPRLKSDAEDGRQDRQEQHQHNHDRKVRQDEQRDAFHRISSELDASMPPAV